MSIVEFLLARIAEDESVARESPFDRAWTAHPDETGQPIKAGGRARIATCAVDVMDHIARHDPARVLAECQAKRAIIEWHKNWPTLVEGPMRFTPVEDYDPRDINSVTFRMVREVNWLTQQQYVERFGAEPPTAPILRMLASVYSDHADFDPAWM